MALALTLAGCGEDGATVQAADPEDDALAFGSAVGEQYDVTVDGAPLGITRYLVTYVADPIQMADEGATKPALEVSSRQKMYVDVPDTSADDSSAAIILRVDN